MTLPGVAGPSRSLPSTGRIHTRLLDGFDDTALRAGAWERLLERSGADVVYRTRWFQRAWWETLGEGRLLLLSAGRDGAIDALAPLYVQDGMAYLLAADESADNVDLLGDTGDPDLLSALLDGARAAVPDLAGLELAFVPAASPTAGALAAAAARSGLDLMPRWEVPAPAVDLTGDGPERRRLTERKSWLRHERHFLALGGFAVERHRTAEDVLPLLGEFFRMHVERRGQHGFRNPFTSERGRRFLERLTQAAGDSGCLRFVRLRSSDRTIAAHFGLCFRGRYQWFEPAFDVSFARHSPGRVLLRHVLLDALDDGARMLDLGSHDQPFKASVASHVDHLRGFGLYPP